MRMFLSRAYFKTLRRVMEAGTSKPAAFDIVVVHSFSRFFRDHFELEFYVRKLAKNGVKLVSMTQELGDDPMHVMMRQIMALFDEYQSKENAKHTLRALKENARQGFWNGSLPPVGYRVVEAEKRGAKVKKMLEIDPLHADTIRLMFKLALEGDGDSGRLKHFNDLWDPTDNLRSILSAISRAKDEVVDRHRYRELAQQMADVAETEEAKIAAEKCLEIATVYDLYEQLKSDRGAVDFGDLVARPTALVESDDAVRTELQGRYKHVLVDEYQDVNRASVRLLRALKPDGSNLWVVGDAKQSIYRFRGASSYNIDRFETEDFQGGTSLQLSMNYRSSQEICNTFSAFATTRMAASGFQANAFKGKSGVAPSFVSVESKDHEIDEIAAHITAAHDETISFRDQAVICKGNARLAEIAAGLEARGIPVLFLGPLFDRPEIKEALSLLSLVIDPRAMGLTCIASMPPFRMSIEDVAVGIETVRAAKKPLPLNWRKLLKMAPGMSEGGRASAKALVDAFEEIEPTATAWQVITKIYLDRTRLAADIATQAREGNANPALALWQFQNFLRSALPERSGYPIRDLLEHIRRLVILSDERDLRDLPAAAQSIDAVRLMTIHGSKGLEFKMLHLPSLTSGSIPRSAKQSRGLPPPDGMIEGPVFRGSDAIDAGHDEEQRCLFFVALSRAEDGLFLYAPNKKSNGHRRSRSSFVDDISGQLSDQKPISVVRDVVGEAERFTLEVDGVDHAGRLFLNRFARFYGIPVIDVGLAMQRRTDTAYDLFARVSTLVPGHPCLLCGGYVDPRRAREEAMRRDDPDAYERLKEEAYVLGEGDPSPAVVTFTTEAAAMAVNEWLAGVTGLAGEAGMVPTRMRRFHARDERRPFVEPRPDCPCCSQAATLGRGDMQPFLDMVS